MGILSALSNKTPATLVLHLDVGQGEARAALLTYAMPGKPDRRNEMVFTSPWSPKTSKHDRGKSLPVTIASLHEALESVASFMKREAKEGRHYGVQSTYCILGAPFYLTYTALIKYREPKGFIVTKELVGSLLAGYRKSTDPEFTSHQEAVIGTAPMTVQEKILHMKVNGYNTSEPYGKHAESLDLSIFKTEASEEIVTAVKKEVNKFFSAPLYIEPMSLAVYVALRDHVHFAEDFLFVVVGSEVTEVSLVRGFTLLETVSFPFGKNSLIRHLSRELKIPEEMVSGELDLYMQKTISANREPIMRNALTDAAEKWFGFYEKGLVSLSDQSVVPATVYLVTDAPLSGVFKTFVERDGFAGQSLSAVGLTVEAIDTEKAKALMNFGREATCDIPMCIEGLFALSTKIPVHTEV
jgi:hypothetical protein